MGKTRTIGLALAALFAISLVSVASAEAALPEFKSSSFPVLLISENVLPLEPIMVGREIGVPVTLTCKTSRDKGEITSANAIKKLLVTYTECKVGSTPCTTAGQASGTIVTKELTGVMGYIKKAAPVEVGTEIKPVSGEFTKFTCMDMPEAVVTGCTIGIAKPLNVSQLTANLEFENNGTTTQTVTKLEGGSACELSMFGAKAALMDNELETFSKTVELKA